MSTWPLQLQLLLRRCNPWALMLSLAGLLALLLWALLLPLAERQLQDEEQRLAMARKKQPRLIPPSALGTTDQLAAFEASLANDEDLARLMRQLWLQGQVAGLQLSKVDYRHEHDLNGRFHRVSITLPLSGPYPAVRQFVFGLMAEYPGLALSRLDMKREQTGSPLVETTVHFILLKRP